MYQSFLFLEISRIILLINQIILFKLKVDLNTNWLKISIQVHILKFKQFKDQKSSKEANINESLMKMKSAAKELQLHWWRQVYKGIGWMYSDHSTVSVLLIINFKSINIWITFQLKQNYLIWRGLCCWLETK